MRAVVQRVDYAKLFINYGLHCQINKGILAFIGIRQSDNEKIMKWMINKLANLRLFNDNDEKMNLSVRDISGDIMLVSNFTIYGDARKGFRPSYTDAAPPEFAEPLYYKFVNDFINQYPDLKIVSGIFGAMMNIELVNNGPVTILIEREN
ncbi:MAG TPA: D-aminoacyl-tRNA deacylase [Bacteroidota bacterium]|nr:D-aminoacyl-tRNA deacylase [Candidatus Kapabacteria bacterium]HRS01720.1 D-aminoacyl-tRNA deacylase [Bacteroidota bacterium]HRT67804.1 D-aminoacyl-tRNA deacylase [Bacteroidota bacterium]